MKMKSPLITLIFHPSFHHHSLEVTIIETLLYVFLELSLYLLTFYIYPEKNGMFCASAFLYKYSNTSVSWPYNQVMK